MYAPEPPVYKEYGKRGKDSRKDYRPLCVQHPELIQHQIGGKHGDLEGHQHQHDIQRKQHPAEGKLIYGKGPCCGDRNQKLSGQNKKYHFYGIPEKQEELGGIE